MQISKIQQIDLPGLPKNRSSNNSFRLLEMGKNSSQTFQPKDCTGGSNTHFVIPLVDWQIPTVVQAREKSTQNLQVLAMIEWNSRRGVKLPTGRLRQLIGYVQSLKTLKICFASLISNSKKHQQLKRNLAILPKIEMQLTVQHTFGRLIDHMENSKVSQSLELKVKFLQKRFLMREILKNTLALKKVAYLLDLSSKRLQYRCFSF